MVNTTLSAAGAASRSSDLYRAVWRWHFYAGLIALPFLILLALTGALYLFRDEIDGFVHRDVMTVEARTSAPAAPTVLVAAALAAHPGTVFKYVPPARPTASAEVGIKTPAGEKMSVFVDPYDRRVLGEIPDKGTVIWIVRQLHSLSYFGPVANGVIEIVGGWTILLVGTGVYLWWPRRQAGDRQGGGVVSVRGRPTQRVFWRDLHAVAGIFAGAFILFLAVTGMPWSVFWGSYVNKWANGTNYGYPAGVYVDVPMSDLRLSEGGPTSWSLEQAQVPQSSAPGAAHGSGHESGHGSGHEAAHGSGHEAVHGGAGGGAAGAGAIDLDAAVAIFDRLGLAKGYAVNPPAGPTGVYTGTVYPDDLSRQRVVHLDQYSGKPLIDMSYADYGPFGKALEWGINVHMGQEFGVANQVVMLAVCVAIVLMAVSAAAMWWKRRPNGSLGVPPMPRDRGVMRGILAILAVGGIVFPLVGASLLVMLAFDWLVIRTPRTRRA
ncbi:PepSY-associated TM helix domain-containing protein [Azospirillum picis]|uniref:Iron-regulated membrane protein n=1 Tax=Azospirillum picis TaxID=488438 RepID=A0ABU0MJ34_9PROT|nr:PepSY domain-containing protein [Azospirillum picis]MBP2299679.1 putative iron-regulated membrane protein [Azospirillum picis]MDQ0533475.1 putative iron-regulated membrane protein [Azospirillum picis]